MSFSFRNHRELEGRHAFMSPSVPHWVNYPPEKLIETYIKKMNAALGTRLHAYAAEAILLGMKQPDTTQTINMYINDCIGLRLKPEVPLAYSENCFGCADAITFDEENKMLRIFDLKNGVTAAKELQLKIYAALFCLEYKVKPFEIGYDLRFYQSDDVIEFHTDPEEIARLMDVIKENDKLIEQSKEVRP